MHCLLRGTLHNCYYIVATARSAAPVATYMPNAVVIVDGTRVDLDSRLATHEAYVYVAFKLFPSVDSEIARQSYLPPCAEEFEQVCPQLRHPLAVENNEADCIYGGPVRLLPDMVRGVTRFFRSNSMFVESFRIEIETEKGPLVLGVPA